MTTKTTSKQRPASEGALHRLPQRMAVEELRQKVLPLAVEIMDRYIGGETMRQICESLAFPIQPWRLRCFLEEFDETKDLLASAGLHRAHDLVEAALVNAKLASALGESAGYRVANDTYLKVAAKLAPAEYGDKSKLELTGKDGGAIKVEADMTLSPADAYERMVKGS